MRRTKSKVQFCPAVQPGKKDKIEYGCIRLFGHDGYHVNGRNTMWPHRYLSSAPRESVKWDAEVSEPGELTRSGERWEELHREAATLADAKYYKEYPEHRPTKETAV